MHRILACLCRPSVRWLSWVSPMLFTSLHTMLAAPSLSSCRSVLEALVLQPMLPAAALPLASYLEACKSFPTSLSPLVDNGVLLITSAASSLLLSVLPLLATACSNIHTAVHPPQYTLKHLSITLPHRPDSNMPVLAPMHLLLMPPHTLLNLPRLLRLPRMLALPNNLCKAWCPASH
jgi:hypothetical protein